MEKVSFDLIKREFEPLGDVSNWLTSEAFDLPSARSPEIAALLEEASELLETPGIEREQVEKMHQQLKEQLNKKDGFLFRWRHLCQVKGFLK